MITILKGIVIVVAIFICEIIMILNRLGLGLNGVDCPQRDVLCDGNLIARVDELVVFRFPSAEVFGIFRRKYAGGAAAYILLVIYFLLSPSTYVTVKPSFAEGKNGEIVTEL